MLDPYSFELLRVDVQRGQKRVGISRADGSLERAELEVKVVGELERLRPRR